MSDECATSAARRSTAWVRARGATTPMTEDDRPVSAVGGRLRGMSEDDGAWPIGDLELIRSPAAEIKLTGHLHEQVKVGSRLAWTYPDGRRHFFTVNDVRPDEDGFGGTLDVTAVFPENDE